MPHSHHHHPLARFSSLQDQLSSARLVMFTEAQSSAGLALAPPLTLNHHRTMFNLLWSVSLHTHDVHTYFHI